MSKAHTCIKVQPALPYFIAGGLKKRCVESGRKSKEKKSCWSEAVLLQSLWLILMTLLATI